MALLDLPDEASPDDRLARKLLAALPFLAERCADLAVETGERPSPSEIFGEAAVAVGEALEDRGPDCVGEVMEVIEDLVAEAGAEGRELIAYCFLDAMLPGTAARAAAYFGPLTEHLREALDSGTLEDVDGLEDGDGPEDGPEDRFPAE
ncbi:MAG: hypothetical protein M0Z87_11840 [Actinomycetota bacterium]|nr:hypothetical protein [Actinomycetota bacterium]